MDSSSSMSASMDGDDASCSSSDGEQVIEITSHSRILISPRKVRGSAWDEKPPGPRHTRAKAVGKTRTPPTNERRSREVSKGRNAARRGPSNQKRKAEKPRKSESSRPASFPKETTRKQANNHDEVSDSDFDSEDAESTSRDRMSHRSDEESCDSEASIENASPKSPAPEPRGVHRSRGQEATGDSSAYLASSLDDSMQSLAAPTTPGEEMEELKATLKKLASHDEDDSRHPLLSTKASEISSASALREYLTVANATTAEQLRPGEYTRPKTRHASFQPPRSTSTQRLRVKAKSMREPGSEDRARRDDPLAKLPGRNPETVNERFSLHKKLFSTPPPPAGGSGGGSALPFGGGGPTGGSGSNGSRAVLSALKALQDKISRLEEERETLRQQLSDTKLVARKREAELAAAEKRFTYELGQMKEAARAAYDSLRGDRDELKLQLVKSEERRKAVRTELQHFQELAKTVSAKADDLQTQLQGSETHRTRLLTEIQQSEKEHEHAVCELQTELVRVRQELQTHSERNELLEAQVQREASNHADSRERLQDSEQAAAALSQLNEKLVAKVWEATEAANQATKRHRKLQQQQRPSTLLRPTAASRASAAAVSDAASRRAAATGSQSSLHASPARNPKKKKPGLAGKSSISAKKLKKPKSSNNMTLLREANLGKEIPFLLGHSAQPSFSVIGNIQDALRRCDTTYVMPTLHDASAHTTPKSTSSRRQPSKSTATTPRTSGDAAETPATGDAPPTMIAARRSAKQKPPAIKVPTAASNGFANPMQSQIMEDLGAAVEAADQEFQTLNKRYKALVVEMEASSRRGPSGSGAAGGGGSTSTQLSQTLGPLLDELEAKAKQLNLLKQVFQQAANSSINPPRRIVHSPEAIRRKTASLRLLQGYRQLESEAKNKGSGGVASPPLRVRAAGFFH